MSIQRQAMMVMTNLYAVYPDLEKLLSCRMATELFSAMAISNMCTQDDTQYYFDREAIHTYVTQGIMYELNIRAIARSLNIDENIASGFVRGCFITNKIGTVYPCVYDIFGVSYEHVSRHIGNHLTQYVIEFLAGDRYHEIQNSDIDPQPKIDSRRNSGVNQKIYGTFYLLKDFLNIKKIRGGLPIKLYFLEVIQFIQSHPDRRISNGEFASKKIFIDEIIDYAREYDEVRFEQFRDGIAELLLLFDDCSILPDCQSLKVKLGLSELITNINTIKNGFTWFMKLAESEESLSESKSDGDSHQEADSINESKIYSENMSESNTETTFEPNTTPNVVRPASIVALHEPDDFDRQFKEDIARAIELSLNLQH